MTHTTVASPRADDGGMVARRAVIRWSWRLFRRQWRGQALVVAMLILTVSGAVVGGASAYNLAPAAGNSVFGSADHSLLLEEPDPDALQVDLEAAEATFGQIVVITRRFQEFAGLFEAVEFRSVDPEGPFVSPMLALVEGRYPTAMDEVAVTDGVASLYEVNLDGRLPFAAEQLTVVGIVENPSNLSDEFALLAPGRDEPVASATILTDADADQVLAFRPPSGSLATVASRPGSVDVLATIGVLVLSTVALALVALVASAGFVVMAHRRLRQLGMLAALGATGRNLRLVMSANGLFVGVISAVAGVALGLVAWLLLLPVIEVSTAHRIDPLHIPWWLPATAAGLSVMAATAAAWLPAREVARTPIVDAISGRPPRPRGTSRSSLRGVLLLVAGVGSIALAGDPAEGWISLVLIVVGTVAIILGVLAIGPAAIGLASRMARSRAVATRLAVRDMSRHQSRSGAALGAISLALGMAVAIVLGTSAALFASGSEGNLAENQLIVRVGEIPSTGDVAPIPERGPEEIAELDRAVEKIATAVGEGEITPVDVAVIPDMEGFSGVAAAALTRQVEPGQNRILSFLYVASQQMLNHYQTDLSTLDATTEVLTVEEGPLFIEPIRPELVERRHNIPPGYTSLPGSFITPDALESRGWDQTRALWLVESTASITEEQFTEARQIAAVAGITVEARADQANLRMLRTLATVAGIAIAAGIVAVTVGLLRSEAGADLKTLTATGAPSRIRRSITASTAGSLALLGALLGCFAAYAGFVAAYWSDLRSLLPIPVLHLTLIIVGLPAIVTGLSWLMAGREPASISRRTNY